MPSCECRRGPTEQSAEPIGCFGEQSSATVNKFLLIAAAIFAATPAAAQLAAPSGRVRSSTQGATGQSGPTGPPQAPITGVFCIEEMTATFCNVVTGPNTGGYGGRPGSGSGSSAGASGAAGGTGGGAGGGTSSIPPCAAEPPFNELCD
jgi:hypothetical protein